MKTKNKTKNHSRKATSRSRQATTASQPFIEHALELRRRLYCIVASVLVWGAAAYAVQQHIVNALLTPAHGQHFIYTTPGGGIDFLFRICVYTGLICSLPIIVYNLLRFLDPMLSRPSRRLTVFGSLASGILAIAGIIFGYYIGLPAALHFLLHQFTTVQIQPLVTIQSYLGFVIVYMVGSAMLFQLPLLLLFINRIKPLKPSRLIHYERWVILAAFVLAGLMNPSPNILSQLLVAGPFILMYQIGIILIYMINRSKRSHPVEQLFEQDKLAQAERLKRDIRPIATYDRLSTAPVQAAQPILLTNRQPKVRPHLIAEVHRPMRPSREVNRQVICQPLFRQTATLSRSRFMDFIPASSVRSRASYPEA